MAEKDKKRYADQIQAFRMQKEAAKVDLMMHNKENRLYALRLRNHVMRKAGPFFEPVYRPVVAPGL